MKKRATIIILLLIIIVFGGAMFYLYQKNSEDPVTYETEQATKQNIVKKTVATGSISASVTGGTGTITYLWSNGATTQSSSNIIPGTYSVTATDATGCTGTATTVVDLTWPW